MPSITQQDYIHIDLGDYTDISEEVKDELRKRCADGTIWDCILKDVSNTEEDGVAGYGRVVGVEPRENGEFFIRVALYGHIVPLGTEI